MKLEDRLSERIGAGDIEELRRACAGADSDREKEQLFSLTAHADERIAYNALWVFTHFRTADMRWLQKHRNSLIDRLLATTHLGCRRLILTLLDRLSTSIDDVRTDYLDYCLAHINSTEPIAIRSLSVKQAYAQCRFYPELIMELRAELELMEQGEMTPGLRSIKKNTLKKIDS